MITFNGYDCVNSRNMHLSYDITLTACTLLEGEEIYFLSFDVGIRRKICSRILRDATEGCAEDV